jgi:hypothetical protein
MKRLFHVLLLASLPASAAFATVPLTFENGVDTCKRNCGQTTQSGNQLLVTLVDKSGKPFKTASYPIDPSATKIEVSPARADQPLKIPHGAHGPVTTRTASATITTATQQIVISQIFYYAKGALIDVRLVDQTFTKEI